jgi:hypothetical protein
MRLEYDDAKRLSTMARKLQETFLQRDTEIRLSPCQGLALP